MITTQVSAITYVGDAVVTDFPVPFPFLEPEYIVVKLIVDGVSYDQTFNIHYTVDEATSEGVYGTVEMVTAPEVDATLSITRSIPVTQEVDYQRSDRFNPEVVERSLDKLTLLFQGQKESSDRYIQFPDGEPSPISNLLPAKSLRPNTVLGFDSLGNLKIYTMAELVDSTADTPYATESIVGNFTIIAAHRGRSLHVSDDSPAGDYIGTLPDAAEIGDGFFCTVVRACTGNITFESVTTINAEVDPVVLQRDNAGVVVYTHAGEWWVAGALGESFPAPDVTIEQTIQSGTHLGASAPVTPYLGQLWIDSDDNRSQKRWNGTSWDVVTPIVDHADFVTGEAPVRLVASLPTLPDADWPAGSTAILTTDGQFYRTVAGTAWLSSAAAAAAALVSEATVVNEADVTRSGYAVGKVEFTYPAILSAELTQDTDVVFTDSSLIFYSWTQGAAVKLANRVLNATTRAKVNIELWPTVGSGADATIWVAYRLRTNGGAWGSWVKPFSSGGNTVFNNTGSDQTLHCINWDGRIATPADTDVQFGMAVNRDQNSIDINTSRISVACFNL
jgi:hypothetical protein